MFRVPSATTPALDATQCPQKVRAPFRQRQEGAVGTGSIGYTLIALPALLLLAGCFGIPAATDPPPSVVVAPANAVTVVACTESGADMLVRNANAPEREAVCLKELGGRASRKGHVLSLKLDNGATKTFRSHYKGGEDTEYEQYYLVGFYSTYATAGAYLVVDLQYEYTSYRLVNVHTGETTKVEGVPRLAPDNLTFFVKECDGGCSIAIRSRASPARPLWESQIADGVNGNVWDFVRWIDSNQIAVRSVETADCPHGGCEAILKRDGSSWKIENLLAKSDAK
jgi:hypothetical protein